MQIDGEKFWFWSLSLRNQASWKCKHRSISPSLYSPLYVTLVNSTESASNLFQRPSCSCSSSDLVVASRSCNRELYVCYFHRTTLCLYIGSAFWTATRYWRERTRVGCM